jgi:hypothetical protein
MMKLRYVAFSALLAASPLCGAMAQQTTSPAVGAGNTKEDTAVKNGMAMNNAGETGRTAVPGSHSTVAGDKPATADTKTGGTGSSSNGK